MSLLALCRPFLADAAGVAILLCGTAGAAGPPEPVAKPPAQLALPDSLWSAQAASTRGMVVTGSSLASRAGALMLERGGNAIDAAVAAAFALGAAEPGSSGLGGQTYILVRLAGGRCLAIDGSARAPLRAPTSELQRFRERNGELQTFFGYEPIATPGSLAALTMALERYGTKSLAEVIAPAIEIAETGFTMAPSQRGFLEYYLVKVHASPYLSALFLKDGVELWDADHVFCNPDLAATLRRIVAHGAADFYRGEIAAEIERDMIEHGGWLRRADLALMAAVEREPLRGRYRGLEVVSFPFPGGGSTVVEALGILDRFPQETLQGDSVDRLHLLLEACRLAYADSSPARKPPRTPDELASDPAYVTRRAALIDRRRALSWSEVSPGPLSTLEVGGTSQVSTADVLGNVVSLTQTLGAAFGSGVTTGRLGFIHNTFMNGFDFSDPRAWGYLRPLQPPMTSMAPTILLAGGAPVLALGSSGSSRIAPAIVSTVSAWVDRRPPLCEAVAAPRALWGGNADPVAYLEMVEPIGEEQADALKARGFVEQFRLVFPPSPFDLTEFGGVNALSLDPQDGTFVGVGDARRNAAPAAPFSPGTAP